MFRVCSARVKTLTLLIFISIVCNPARAQNWNLSGADIYNTNSGNVGIGTTTPQAKLDVRGLFFLNRPSALVDNLSTLGIPAGSYLGIAPSDLSATQNSYMLLLFPDSRSFRIGTNYDGHLGSGYYRDIQFGRYLGDAYMTIKDGGNVLIGKTSQTNASYILDVNGSARASRVVVNTTGADFVFEPGYRLPPLAKVADSIRMLHHLPGVPSAAEMQREGLDVGENQTRLLAKVEELTLYLIKLEEKVSAQQKEIDRLKDRGKRKKLDGKERK